MLILCTYFDSDYKKVKIKTNKNKNKWTKN